MPRRYERNEIEIDRYETDQRSSYAPSARARYAEPDIDFRRGSGPPPTRERERERETVIIKERDEYDRTPAFLRDDYGKSNAGTMVLRAKDREDITYAPRRRRSPSPEKVEREEIIIRRDERSESRPPPPRARERSREREEIIIRRDEREQSRPPPPRPRERSLEREEIIIRRDEVSDPRPPAPRYREKERPREREEIIIKRRDDDERSYAPSRRPRTEEFEHDREEIIIRRGEREREDDVVSRRSYRPPPPPAREVGREEIIIRRERDVNEDERLSRPMSRERARSGARSRSRDSEEEIIIRRDEREGRRGEETRQEIIIRRSSRSRSPSPVESVRTVAPPVPAPAPPEPQIVYAPQIHQEVITHHRHIDHGYEVRLPPRREPIYSRPPSTPSPPPPPPPPEPVRERSEERIEIRRTDTRNGRRMEEDIIIDRHERDRSEPAPSVRTRGQSVDIRDEVDYRRDWAVRSYKAPEPEPEPEPEPPTIGPRYGRRQDPRDGLWTEVTKDLVVREAIEEMGYEYEESDDFYYIFKYMGYGDVARLVGLSEDIRKQRHKRINEIRWENAVTPRSPIAPASPRRYIEGPPPRDDRNWEREDERYIEREVVYRGGRPPPPVAWRR